MKKCDNCIVCIESFPYECSVLICESEYFETDDNLIYKFNYCPICGHKINFR